ncbi:TPA: RNA-binding protein [Candidatus Micrarchaeota archaeon]|nr:RNA-binding protein [Candidatus Micrarchaeota archaeon]
MICCGTCGREVKDYIKFKCPGDECKEEIVRCRVCRENENKYVCKCGFSGP